jgi:hypothetical protein
MRAASMVATKDD